LIACENIFRRCPSCRKAFSGQKGIGLRLIVETTKDNVEVVKSLEYRDVRHISGIMENFGIFDSRAYMVYISQEGWCSTPDSLKQLKGSCGKAAGDL
jgi:hypothetical protein